MSSTISELIITVGDLDEAVTFYTETLGMDYVRRRTVDGGSVVQLTAGGARVSLLQGATPGVRVVLETTDIHAVGRRLARRGVDLPAPPTTAAGSTVLPFADPWGNPLAYWEPA